MIPFPRAYSQAHFAYLTITRSTESVPNLIKYKHTS